jgi:uncharacterized membrane protein YozB (DUF420 family)
MNLSILPHLNAFLNATSTLILLIGYHSIRRGKRAEHKKFMLSALGTSTLFIISYLIYHLNFGALRFAGQGTIRPVYFAILTSHTVLAILVAPMVLYIVALALRGETTKHKGVARIVLPTWIYVNVTGIIVYVMLYHLYPLS